MIKIGGVVGSLDKSSYELYDIFNGLITSSSIGGVSPLLEL